MSEFQNIDAYLERSIHNRNAIVAQSQELQTQSNEKTNQIMKNSMDHGINPINLSHDQIRRESEQSQRSHRRQDNQDEIQHMLIRDNDHERSISMQLGENQDGNLEDIEEEKDEEFTQNQSRARRNMLTI